MKTVKITEQQYNYLLPAYNLNGFGKADPLFTRTSKHGDTYVDTYYFFGSDDQINDMYKRLEGLAW